MSAGNTTSMRDAMEAAQDHALAMRAARRDYEAATPLSAFWTRGGKVHAGRRSFNRPQYVTLACSGRSVTGAVPTDQAISCKSCQKRMAS